MGATQALFFVDVAWKIWKERADAISQPGNAFSLASLRMLDIVSTSDFFRKGGGASVRQERDGAQTQVVVVLATLQERGTWTSGERDSRTSKRF
jgi:hypothetical protein